MLREFAFFEIDANAIRKVRTPFNFFSVSVVIVFNIIFLDMNFVKTRRQEEGNQPKISEQPPTAE